MRCAVVAVVVLGFLTGVPRKASAGPYGDEMTKCFVAATSDADKADLVRWIFSSAALHPAVSSIATVAPEQRTEVTKKFAALLERLFTDVCGAPSKAAFKNEGPGVFTVAFQALVQVATGGLFTHPAVVAGSADLQRELNGPKIKAFLEGN